MAVKGFNVVFWNSSKLGTLNADEIQKRCGNLKTKDFYLCGPRGFKKSIINSLLEKGVKKSKMHTEEFEFR